MSRHNTYKTTLRVKRRLWEGRDESQLESLTTGRECMKRKQRKERKEGKEISETEGNEGIEGPEGEEGVTENEGN